MRASGKLGSLHQVVDLRRELSMAYNALATSDALIASNPDLVRRMVRAILKGVRHVKASKADTVATLLRHGATHPEAVELEYDNLIDSITMTGTMPKEDQAFDTSLRADMLEIPKEKAPHADSVFDFSFADKANAELQAEGWKPKLH